MSAKKYFEDNIRNHLASGDPAASNLNKGLYEIAKQQEHLEGMLTALQRQLQTMHRELQQLKSR